MINHKNQLYVVMLFIKLKMQYQCRNTPPLTSRGNTSVERLGDVIVERTGVTNVGNPVEIGVVCATGRA